VTPEIQKFIIPNKELDGELGIWMSTLDELRQLTKQSVSGLSSVQLQSKPIPNGNSIGQLLRHIAIVELDWMLTDICNGEPMPADAPAMIQLDGPMSDPGSRSIDDFFAALDYVRTQTKQRLKQFDGRRECEALRKYAGEDVHKEFNVRWILFHLVEHESHHKGQIHLLRRLLAT